MAMVVSDEIHVMLSRTALTVVYDVRYEVSDKRKEIFMMCLLHIFKVGIQLEDGSAFFLGKEAKGALLRQYCALSVQEAETVLRKPNTIENNYTKKVKRMQYLGFTLLQKVREFCVAPAKEDEEKKLGEGEEGA